MLDILVAQLMEVYYYDNVDYGEFVSSEERIKNMLKLFKLFSP